MSYASLGHGCRTWLGAALLCLVLAGQQGAEAAGDSVTLVPHRAVYDLTLSATRGGTGVVSVAGRMVYDLVGSHCEGYTQNMRLVSRIVHEGGNVTVMDLRTSTWEDGEGKRFRFDLSKYRGEKATETTAGEAYRKGPGGEIRVDLSKPEKRSIFLPAGAYFPIQHTIALIQAARAGKASLRADLYDGSDKGEEVIDTVSALGRVQAPGANRKLPKANNADRLGGVRSWPVSIAFFASRSDRADALPTHEIAFWMFENGVSRKIGIDYGDFALHGNLTEILFHEPSKCEQK